MLLQTRKCHIDSCQLWSSCFLSPVQAPTQWDLGLIWAQGADLVGPFGDRAGLLGAGGGHDARQAGGDIGVGFGIPGEAVGDPVDHVVRRRCDDAGMALTRVDPPFEVLAESAEVGGEQGGGDDGDLLVAAALDDEERARGWLR